jgi:hypothetical protein
VPATPLQAGKRTIGPLEAEFVTTAWSAARMISRVRVPAPLCPS